MNNKKWKLFDQNKLYQIKHSNCLLYIENNSVSKGAKLLKGFVNDTNNTLFMLKHVKQGYHTIKAFHSDLNLEIQDSKINDGTLLVQNKESNKTNQQFRFEINQNGKYLIRARCSSKILGTQKTTCFGAEICQLTDIYFHDLLFTVIELD